MPIYKLDKESLWFPPPEEFEDDVVAVGGDLRPERLLEAYRNGIFPWYNEPGELVWWCPVYRCVLSMQNIRISHSMEAIFKKKTFRYTMDQAFPEVLEGCRSGVRENATWIHDEVVAAYLELHRMGLAHSVETWLGDELVGGLYGVNLGRMFFGESMFSKVSNASKFAFLTLAAKLEKMDWRYLDCQVYTSHLGTLGASNVPRNAFLHTLSKELKYPTLQGDWGKMDCFADGA